MTLAGIQATAGFAPLLPDAKLTPGRIGAQRRETRGVMAEVAAAVFDRYRIPFEQRRFYVLDHLIPKELGGSDAIENLWPQHLLARPYGPRRKQVLTRHLLALVGSKKMTLQEAQSAMSDDWISAFVIHIGMVYLSPASKHPMDKGEGAEAER